MARDKVGDFEQQVLLFDARGTCHSLGRFRPSDRYYTELRCDLHPRWDMHGRNVIFDSAHDRGRAIYLANVNHVVAGREIGSDPSPKGRP